VDSGLLIDKAAGMAEEWSVAQLVARIEAGDQEAAAELVERYGRHVERIVRLGLTDARLRQRVDSLDICQSIFRDFFLAVALGDCRIDSPKRLLQILGKIAENRVVDQARRHKAAKRDIRKTEPADTCKLGGIASTDTPSQIVGRREILKMIDERLRQNDRWLVEQRIAGRAWDDIGKEIGKSPDAVRKYYDRVIERVRKELGFTDG
jgi:RNA polymerase sigma factor (sigma-70 family)